MSDRPADTAAATDPPPAPTPGWLALLQRVDAAIGTAEQYALCALLAFLIALGAYQAIGRNFFNASPVWSFDALRISVFFIAMTGAALSAHTKQIIRMDVLTRILSPRGRALARIATALFTIAVCFFLAYAGWHLRTALLDEKDAAFLAPSTAVLALPIGALLIAFHLAVQSLAMTVAITRGELPEEEAQAVH